MAGSGDKRLKISDEAAEHVATDPKVAQVREQINNPRTFNALFDDPNPAMIEQMRERELLDESVIAAQPSERLVTDEMIANAQARAQGLYSDARKNAQLRSPVPIESGGDDLTGVAGQMQPQMQPAIAENLAETLSSSQLSALEQEVCRGFELDEQSRAAWLEGVERAQKLMDHSRSPEGHGGRGAGVSATSPKNSILQTAAQQFEARITPILISASGPLVKMRPQGRLMVAQQPQQGQQGQQVQQVPDKTARAERVEQYLSYQLRRKNKHWIADTRRAMMKLCLYGSVFRKVMYSADLGAVTARIVDAADVVFQADAGSMEEAPRITHRLKYQSNQVISLIRAGFWRDITEQLGLIREVGVEARSDENFEFLECHLRYDLDGDDYPEPLIVTCHRHAGQVVRVERNYDEEDVRRGDDGSVLHIEPRRCFVQYNFLPDPSGGLYGLGLGHTMRNQLNSINTLEKQLQDAALLSNSTGGFMAKGLRFGRSEQAGSQLEVQANRFHFVNVTGEKLRDSIVPFSFPQPSQVTFQLLDLYMSQARDLAAVINPLSLEEIGANFSRMPVGTIQALLSQSLEVFSGILSGVHYSMSQEFELFYKLTGLYLNEADYRNVLDDPDATAADFMFGDYDICPVADPRTGTDLQKSLKAVKFREMLGDPHFNQAEVLRRYVEAEGFENPQNLLATPDERQAAMQQRREEIAIRMAELDLMEREARINEIATKSSLNQAKATKAMTDAESTVFHDEVLAPIELEIEERRGRDKRDIEVARSLGKDPKR